ncbi:winged helix-turn-helix domain-containing protein [Aliiglaciecola sp. M165]|uniref:winged helix-turn-helix domain-containing protein n=1 Tax=Aliiglaciecola sp. M165 TaxID=2593649 RepID=UPI00117C093B|nr:winged helix-turn-helix domain-containing protein [Aliiglaciecola sp. M165]TRY33427.1 hypothetical protein FM019_05480 [Aliiglaciecola sp. M165]
MSRVTFKEFEFDLETKELMKSGQSVPLQPKQADVLCLLLQRPGSLVSREELKADAWGDTVVEFDQSINFCIKGIRQALGDNPKAPVFIQTIPRRGYRFVAPVEDEATNESKFDHSSHTPTKIDSKVNPTSHTTKRGLLTYLVAPGAGLVFAVSAALWWSNLVQPSLDENSHQQSTQYEDKISLNFQRAVHQFEKGEYTHYASSYKMFGEITKTYPEYPDVQAYLGISALYSNVENSQKIIKESSELARLYQPESAMTSVIEGMVLLYLDWDISSAHQKFLDAVAIEPKLTIGWHELSVTSAILGDIDLAYRSIEHALQLDPGGVQERYHAGWIYSVGGDHRLALAQCEQTLELKPEHLFSFKCAAESALALGLNEKAKRYYVTFMQKYGAKPEQIELVENQLNKQETVAFYEWLFALWQKNQAPAFFLATLKASTEDYPMAESLLKQAVENKERYVPLALAYPEFRPMWKDQAYQELKQSLRL